MSFKHVIYMMVCGEFWVQSPIGVIFKFFWVKHVDGVAKSAKLILELADPINYSITYGLIEGDLKSDFSSFIVKFEITPKDEGCTVRLTLGYVKLNQNVEPPQSLLELGSQVIKELGDYLAQA
ncbi:hypothetical protein REPUB_Repub04eG0211100 [Reevesia pubescens]